VTPAVSRLRHIVGPCPLVLMARMYRS
jgi:hypothetical protein